MPPSELYAQHARSRFCRIAFSSRQFMCIWRARNARTARGKSGSCIICVERESTRTNMITHLKPTILFRGAPSPSFSSFLLFVPPLPHLHNTDNAGGCCGMIISRADLSPFSTVIGSKQHAFVAAAVVRGRVRQRESSSTLQQAPAAAAARRQLLTATTINHDGANGSTTIRERLTVGPVHIRSKNSRGSGEGNEVYISRNRMMAAAKRRRWTEVSRGLTDRERSSVAMHQPKLMII